MMVATIESCDFQTLAHLDFPKRYFDHWNVKKAVIDNILKLIIQRKIALEVNTSTVNISSTESMPSVEIVKRYVELGGTMVTLGSDAHKCSDLANGFKEVISTSFTL